MHNENTIPICCSCRIRIHAGEIREDFEEAPFHQTCLRRLRGKAKLTGTPISVSYWQERTRRIIVVHQLQPLLIYHHD